MAKDHHHDNHAILHHFGFRKRDSGQACVCCKTLALANYFKKVQLFILIIYTMIMFVVNMITTIIIIMTKIVIVMIMLMIIIMIMIIIVMMMRICMRRKG